MYLKNIDIQGFKSFAHKISFQFHNGITAIVGPNGSGKSNVADAVRWVLGEQRVKQLRGANMQDIIFSGTEARKPLSYAYVSITLDNQDHQLMTPFDEVTVARRIYRSGESEYLLNGTVCRLKDVHELFYDTGIGKEGYSIIGQGQIDKILSGKPEERRELFDEAAGIVKFKRRKATTQQKLESEKTNLVRVKDILAELEKQIEPLEKRSAIARTYLKKRDELKDLDIQVFLQENRQLNAQLDAVTKKSDLTQDQLRETTTLFDEKKAMYEQVNHEVQELESSIDEQRLRLSDSGVAREKAEGQINLYEEQIRVAKDTATQLMERTTKLHDEYAAKEAELAKMAAQRETIDVEHEAKYEAFLAQKEALGQLQATIQTQMDEIEKIQQAIIEELGKRALIQSNLGRLDHMTESIQIQRAQIQAKLLQAKTEETVREEGIHNYEADFDRIGQELLAMRQKEEEQQKSLLEFRDVLTKKDEALREVSAKYHQDKTKLDALSNLLERYEGYGGAIKRIMERRASEPGIIGVVADIIHVEQKYEVAIETALGGNIQNIVTDNAQTAKRLITFLKKERIGRATFLPLSNLSNPQEFTQTAILKEKGVIGLADQVVQVAKEYQNVAKSLLGRIVVVDHIDHAIELSRKYDAAVRMVTLEGELFTPGGAISGGAYKNNSNLLGRRRELEELERIAKAHQLELDRLNKEIAQVKVERNRMRVEIESMKTLMQQKSMEQNEIRINLFGARERMQEEADRVNQLRTEKDDVEDQVITVDKERIDTQAQLVESEKLEASRNDRLLTCQQELAAFKTKEAQALQETTALELEVEKMNQSKSFYQSNVDRIRDEMQHIQEDEQDLISQQHEKEAFVLETITKMENMRKMLEESFLTQTKEELLLQESIAKKEQLVRNVQTILKDREELSQSMNLLDKELFRQNAQKEKFEEMIESLLSYMWNEYEMTLSDAVMSQAISSKDLAMMKKEILALREEIKKLGDVNIGAIEDYRLLMERYDFMKTQHDDLVEAQSTLEGIIEELDRSMRKQFMEKFAKIAKEFDKVFQELFGGGKASVELIEDEDILEAGIRVIAQPPGKKLQNMLQLSGGEKALTAISLLFAIQNLKPSPFCLLDEIEAALDESNVGRFAKYLHKLTKSTQFIVITHRRGTMEQADRLYGITMQEKGVSALVSVNLVEKELEVTEHHGNRA
ncbi:MAG: chromosome segregation protein SMC [Clostridium sp.]|nr:chromosome segregation protein SMC [Clostridium sp.]